MKVSAPMIITGTAALASVGTLAYAGVKSVTEGTPVLQTLGNTAEAARGAVASTVGAVNPTFRNQGVRATPAQIEAWCRKVNRTQGARGINEVGRQWTSPYINPSFPLDLRGFVQAAAEGTGTGLKGGTILAVLLSIETWAGVAGHNGAGCWNHNAGNFKLYSAQWHADQTPPCYFLVDRVPSLDFYPSFDTWAEGIRAWASATFANQRYNQYGTMDALRSGNIRAFTRAIGQAGYARMYRNPRSMDARAKLLAGMAPYQRNRAVIDGSNLFFDDSIPARVAV